MLYQMSFEFRLTRLVPWADDGEDFYSHVESVRAKIGAQQSVEQVRTIADMAESRLNVEFLIDAERHQDAIAISVAIIRTAIESSNARHFGMEKGSTLSLASAGARTGLDIPIWHRLRMLMGIAA